MCPGRFSACARLLTSAESCPARSLSSKSYRAREGKLPVSIPLGDVDPVFRHRIAAIDPSGMDRVVGERNRRVAQNPQLSAGVTMSAMRLGKAALLVAVGLMAAGANAQVWLHALHEEECGNPLMESQFWFSVRGKVVRIVRPNALLIRTYADEGCTGKTCVPGGILKQVLIPGVDVSGTGRTARAFLKTLVGRDLEVMSNETSAYTVSGQVHVEMMDLSSTLLARGLARFAPIPPYVVSSYTTCTYQIAEREARAARVGLWAAAAGGE